MSPKQPLHQANGKGFNKNPKPVYQPTTANTLMVQAIQPISTDRGWTCSVLCQDAESPTKRLMLHCLRVKVAGTEVLAPEASGATPGWPRAWRFGFYIPVGHDMIKIDQQDWVQVCFLGYPIFAFTSLRIFVHNRTRATPESLPPQETEYVQTAIVSPQRQANVQHCSPNSVATLRGSYGKC